MSVASTVLGKPYASLLLAALVFASGLACGYFAARLKADKEIAVMSATQAKTDQARADAQAEIGRLAARHYAQNESRLLAQQTRINANLKAQQHDIKPHLTGRNCLSAPAVRVLNRADSARAGVPQTAASTVAEGAQRFATDADVGHWAIEARAQYATCAQRLNTLIDAVAVPAPKGQHE